MLAFKNMAGYSREFLSIEQALKQVVKDLKSEGVWNQQVNQVN